MALDIENAKSIPMIDRLQQLVDSGERVRVYLTNQARLEGEIVSLLHDHNRVVCGFIVSNPRGNGNTDVLLTNTVSIERP